MSKYYVQSGYLQAVVVAVTPEQAAMKAFRSLKAGIVISPLVVVSERGFDYHSHEQNEDVFFATRDVIMLMELAGDHENFPE